MNGLLYTCMSLQRARRLFRACSGGAWQRVTHRQTYKKQDRARDFAFFFASALLPSLREQTGNHRIINKLACRVCRCIAFTEEWPC